MRKHRFITSAKWLLRKLARSTRRYSHVTLGILAVFIGAVVAYGSIGFRWLIENIALVSFGGQMTDPSIPWWRIMIVPVLGGILVGIMLKYLTKGKRAGSVAEVIEANALREGKMSWQHGIHSVLITTVSLGTGASAGREGPVVHMGASFASWFSSRLHLTPAVARTLLACGVASAVAASFNAPIAGVFFALEVVLGHYAIHTFAPVVIAGVVGTIISRAHLGNYPAFIIPDQTLVSVWEFPAFVLLGIVSAIIAIAFMRTIVYAEDKGLDLPIPPWALPPIGGIALGAIGVFLPQALGVGYEATDNAIHQNYELWFLLALLVTKIIATAITFGARFGGGIFSPSLYVGAMTGAAFGIIATSLFPEYGSSTGVYAIVGMGAVASAVLGAPVSTILIVFELTGDYSITIAVMIAAAVASLTTGIAHRKSFFYWQLERRGMQLEGGKANYLLKSTYVREVADRDFVTIETGAPLNKVRELFFDLDGNKLLVTDASGKLYGVITGAELSSEAFEAGLDILIRAEDICRINPVSVIASDTLEVALNRMEASGEDHIPVVDGDDGSVTGMLHYRDIMRTYNQALAEAQEDSQSGGLGAR